MNETFHPTQAEASDREAAVWNVRLPWVAGVAMALVPVLLTTVGFAVAGATHQSDRVTYLAGAAATAVSAVVGFLIMVAAKPTLAQFGFRKPENVRKALWFVPAALLPPIAFFATGFSVSPSLVLGFVSMAGAAAFNEEIWYRGLVMSVFRNRGTKVAVAVSSILFGVLHLVNLFGGKSITYAALQFVFAVLFGLVAAELYAITRSLVPAIVWHATYDTAAYLSGDSLSTPALVAIAVMVAILVAYAIFLWRKLPR